MFICTRMGHVVVVQRTLGYLRSVRGHRLELGLPTGRGGNYRHPRRLQQTTHKIGSTQLHKSNLERFISISSKFMEALKFLISVCSQK